MGSIIANAQASLTVTGTTTATGSITWSPPTYPDGVLQWDSVVISGSWTWGGKGSITGGVTINGAKTYAGVSFSINLDDSVNPPITIGCVGNKNATGSNFTWSNLIVTYSYTEPLVLNSISVTYTGGDVSVGTSLSDLTGITVTGNYSDGSSVVITDYTLSGEIAEGTNVITVTYNGFTNAFNVIGVVATIDVVINFKKDYIWVTGKSIYQKINGVWTIVEDAEALFNGSVKYKMSSIHSNTLLDEDGNVLYDENGEIITS